MSSGELCPICLAPPFVCSCPQQPRESEAPGPFEPWRIMVHASVKRPEAELTLMDGGATANIHVSSETDLGFYVNAELTWDQVQKLHSLMSDVNQNPPIVPARGRHTGLAG